MLLLKMHYCTWLETIQVLLSVEGNTKPEYPKLSQSSTYILSCCRISDVYTYIYLSYSETDMLTHIMSVMHPPKHIHACKCNTNKHILPPPSIHIVIKPPQLQSQPVSAPVLQSTPEAESAGWMYSVLTPRLFALSLPFLFITFLPRQWCMFMWVPNTTENKNTTSSAIRPFNLSPLP